jgi:hypothetical protein
MTDELKRLLALREELKSVLDSCIGQLEARKVPQNARHIANVVDTSRTINSTLEILCNSILLLEQGESRRN